MDSNFAVEKALLIGLASFAGHAGAEHLGNHALFMLLVTAVVWLFKIEHL
jgi:hypothetical protein